MKYPCKTCLVKPACSRPCDEYNIFTNRLVDSYAPVTILIFSILLIVSGFVVILTSSNPDLALRTYFNWVWWTSMTILSLLDWRRFFDSIVSSVLLAPIMLPCMIVWKIQARLYKRF